MQKFAILIRVMQIQCEMIWCDGVMLSIGEFETCQAVKS